LPTHATREESEDVHKANNPWKMSEFATKAPGIDIAGMDKSVEPVTNAACCRDVDQTSKDKKDKAK
jgi:hypothetical protein